MKNWCIYIIMGLLLSLWIGKGEANITTFTAISPLTGEVDDDGTVFTAQAACYPGDFGAGNNSARMFITFNIKEIPTNANITSATLIITSDGSDTGTPFDTLGDLIVEHVNYSSFTNGGTSALDATDFSNTSVGGSCIVYSNLGAIRTNSITNINTVMKLTNSGLRAAIGKDRSEGRTNSQYRVRFQLKTDYDGIDDYSLIAAEQNATPSFRPRLIVEWSTNQFDIVQQPMGANQGVHSSSIAFGDYDNDGDLDIVLTGYDGANPRFIIYRNDAGTFNQVQEPMGANQGVYDSSVAFGDYDNDGDLDIALTGDDGVNKRFIIYRNDAGTFNQVQEPMGANQGVDSSSIAFGDYDNDGDLDIALTGKDNGGTRKFIIYRNDGGIFTNVQEPMGTNQGVSSSSIAFGDYDNDGDLDIALTGYDNSANKRFIIFRNDNGTFTNVQEPMGANQGVYYSSIAFGDYDNDGDLDIALTGNDGANPRFIIYRNDAGTFNQVQEPMGANQGVRYSSIAFGDYDNDGDLDIALTGDDNSGNPRFIIYRNDAGTFNQAQEPMGTNQGVYYSSVAFGDYDNDGDLDIALTGSDGANFRFIIFRNNETTVNSAPSVPTGMSADGSSGYWRLSWNHSTDDYTAQNVLRYQIAIGTNPGVYDYASTNIDYPRGQANLGKVTVVTGTPWYQTKISDTKTIYWRVCAIDSAFKHSAYCAEQTASPPLLPQFMDSGQRLDGAPGTTYDLAVGDVDGDGDIDVVYANSAATDSQVFTNNGAGFYGLAQYLDINPNQTSRAILLFDIDNDGDLDIVQGYDDGNVRVWDNTGNPFPGLYVLKTNINIGGQIYALAYGDINKDGALDFIAGMASGNPDFIYTNDGVGNFSLQTTISDFNTTEWVEFFDINNDGNIDIYLGNLGNDGVYTNDRQGNFGLKQNIFNQNTTEVDAGDVNRDGYVDIVVGYSNSGTEIYFNSGPPNYNLNLNQTLSDINGVTRSIKIGDFNNDGFLDIIEANQSGNLCYTNDGFGNFSLVTGTTLGSWDTYRLAFADVDKDNPQFDLDVHIATYSNNLVYTNTETNPNNSPGVPLNLVAITNGNTVTLIWSKAGDDTTPQSSLTYNLYVRDSSGKLWYYAEDISGTGNNQTVGAGYVWTITNMFLSGLPQDNYSWGVQAVDSGYRRSGWATGSFQILGGLPQFVDTGWIDPAGNLQSAMGAFGDMDNDGDLDLVVANYGNPVQVYLNDGTGNLSTNGAWNDGGSLANRSVALGDFNNDGWLDILVGRSSISGNNTLYTNNGTGWFGQKWVDPAGQEAYDLAVGDIDSDGDLDFVVGNMNVANVVFTNDGKGNFAQNSWADPYNDATYAVELADMDNDGDLDLVVGNDNAFNLVFTNNGKGDFGANEVWNDGNNDFTRDLACADINNDGWVDIIFVNNNQANYSYINNQNRTWSSTVVWDPYTDQSEGICVGDFDNDGDVDFIAGNTGSQANIFYTNTGTGVFGVAWSSTNMYDTEDVVAGDIDNDGDLDFVALNYGAGGQVNKIYRNTDAIGNNNPPAVSGLNNIIAGSNVTLSWNKVFGDDHTLSNEITYNLFVKDQSTGRFLFQCDDYLLPGGGIVRKPAFGNVWHNTNITLSNLPYGNYVWGVQAVDTGLRKSVWSTNTFNLSAPYTGPFYVATNGNDLNDGSYSNPFRTIQHAADVMSAGPPICTVATTYIFPGIYNESVYIASNMNPGFMVFTSLSNNNPAVLDGQFSFYEGFNIDAADNIIIDHLKITSFSNRGIIIQNYATNCYVQYNEIYNNGFEGVAILSPRNVVLSNTIYSNQTGINLNSSSDIELKGNSLFKNNDGIYCWQQTNMKLIDNKVYSNNFSGIVMDNCSNSLISNNIIYNSALSNGGSSIYVGGISKDIFIQNNIIYSNVVDITNFYEGIFINSGDANNIFIFSNELYGLSVAIKCEGADNVEIKKNTIYNIEGWAGIVIATNWAGGPTAYANSNTIVSNTIYGKGIRVEYGDGHIIRKNEVRNVQNSPGIDVYAVSNFSIRANILKNNIEALHIDSSSGNVIYNSVESNGRGIIINGVSTGNVKFNKVSDNTNVGVEVGSSGVSMFIRKNNFIGNNINFATVTNYDVRTNWWGTSIKGAIQSKFGYYGPPGSIIITFEPYRLWHQFSLFLGADREPLPVVTNFVAMITNNTNVQLRWNKSPTNDFEYYCIYRSYQGDYGNLEHTTNYIIATTTNTNYLDTPGYGVFYYWVTAVDNPAPPFWNVWTNESWYSVMQTVTIGTGTNVHNVTQDKWYWTIQSAVQDANTDDVIEVYPYGYPDSGSKIYNEKVEISEDTTSATNLIIQAKSWVSNNIIDTIIDGTGNNCAILVSSNRSIELYGFKIKNDTFNGIEITGGSSGNIIKHNIIYSNNPTWSGDGVPPMGVRIQHPQCSYNIIATNEFYNNIVDIGILGGYSNSVYSNICYNSEEGIGFADANGVPAKYNLIKNNIIYNMSGSGIGFHGNAVSSNTIVSNTIYNCTNGIYFEAGGGPGPVPGHRFNEILYNDIYNNHLGIESDTDAVGDNNKFANNIITNNLKAGIAFVSSNFRGNIIISNLIKNNEDGIYLEFSADNIVYSNKLIYNTNGINLNTASGTFIQRNIINCNTGYGFIATNSPLTLLELNNIISNYIGVWMMSGSNTYITKNNLYSNTYNARAPIDGTGLYYTNNWWGTTVYTNITNTIMGSAPPAGNLKPWRLFGPFDIFEGADTDTPKRVKKVTSAIVNGTDVVIKWQSTIDVGGGNVTRYFIYKWITNSPDNVSRAQVIGEVPSTQTSFTEVGGWTGIKYYYAVTALDDYTVYTNESWYSESTSPSTNVWNVTKNIYYRTIKEAIKDADAEGVFNEIRVLTPTNYYEDGIVLNNGQNIRLVSSEWLNQGTYTNTVIVSTNQDANFIFKIVGAANLEIEGFTINFVGTNEDWGAGNVSAAIHYDDTSTGAVKHITFDGMTNGKMGILAGGWNVSINIVSNYFTGFKKAGIHFNRTGSIIANIFTNCDAGIDLDGNSDNTYVSNNTFISNGTGIMVWGDDIGEKIVYNLIINSRNKGIVCNANTHPEIINNTIANGINAYAGIVVYSNSSPIIKNNIIFSNGQYGIYGGTGANPQSSYNNVFGASISNWGGTATFGTGDISDNTPPIFIGGTPYDYHLRDGSPSIAAGENNVDQGCYPYNAVLRILLGDNTKPVGTFQTIESNVAMVQIKFRTETSNSVLLSNLTFTNYGTSSFSLPLEIINVDLYADVNNNGVVDNPDVLLQSASFGGTISATFSNINLNIAGNSETNLIIAYDAVNAIPLETYWPVVKGANVDARTNGQPFTTYGNVTGNTQAVSSGIDHFVVIHNTNAYAKVPTSITFVAKDSNNLTISSYNGTISVWVLNDAAEVFWTNGDGQGTLIDGGVGQDWAIYTFSPLDNGDVTLYLTYYTQGWLNIECRDTNITSATDNDTEGPLYFTNAPVWNVTIDKYYATLQDAIADAAPANRNEIRIMYSYNDGNVLIATNTTSATEFYITSQEWATAGTKNTVLDAAAFDKAISVDSSGMGAQSFRVRIKGFTIKNAYVNGIELLANVSQCTVANMVMISNGYTVSSYPGPAGFGIYITDNQQSPTYNNVVYSNEIYFSQWGIVVLDADNNRIHHNTLKYNRNPYNSNDGGAIAIASMGAPTTNNLVYNNIVISNKAGINLAYNGDNVFNNSVYSNNSLYNSVGIYLEDADKNFVYENYTAYNTNHGIWLNYSASDNKVYDNTVVSNKMAGIGIESTNYTALNNEIYNNKIYNNYTGIYIKGSDKTKIYNNYSVSANTNGVQLISAFNAVASNNEIFNNNSGLDIVESSNTYSVRNKIYNNINGGIWITNSPYTKIELNTITNNNIGIEYYPSIYINTRIIKNNLYGNTTYNLSLSTVNLSLTNNWYGTTIWSNIKPKISAPVVSFSNFAPYRLFGPFNLTEGADIEPPDRITGLTATTNGPQIQLQWNRCTNSDFARYFIYRSAVNDVSNLSPLSIVYSLTSSLSTNYADNPPYSARWYYWVTALDSGGGTIYTNECWYSEVASASNAVAGYVHILPPKDEWYFTITNAVINATNNCVIEVHSMGSPFNESVSISGFTNLTIRAYDWVNGGDNTTTIVDGTGFNSAFIISNSTLIKIIGFSITRATNGVYITGTSVSNYILHNNIYSNETRGIYIDSDTADNNYILTNEIWGAEQNYGIHINNSDNNTIESNKIYDNKTYGMYIQGSGTSNYIRRNNIYNNGTYGIYIYSDTADNNYIWANNIWGLHSYGIYIWGSDNNTIKSNQIYNNSYGIYFYSDATLNYVVRNTIYSNLTVGVYVYGNSADNNYILTNNIWGANQDYGIQIYDSDNNTIKSNQIHNNQYNGIYFTGASISNYIVKNIIYSNASYGIYLDSNGADNNYILTNNIWGLNQNYGIYINNGDNNKLDANRIHHNQFYGIYLKGTAVGNQVINNKISTNQQTGIYCNASSNVFNINTIISNHDNGIFITNANNCGLTNNNIQNNGITGITLANADNNIIWSNIIRNNGSALGSQAIRLRYSDYNNIYKNEMIKNNVAGGYNVGISISYSISNKIVQNTIATNGDRGIAFGVGCNNNYFASNVIWTHSRGFEIANDSKGNIVEKNEIYDCINGFYITNTSASNKIRYNKIRNNSSYGIRFVAHTGRDNEIILNTIISNPVGICYDSTTNLIVKNNIYDNTNWNILNLKPYTLNLTNIWWGTTIASSIASTISNNGGYSNFTPYRLFGPFDITPGADTDRLPAITWATALSGATCITLQWSKPSDTSGFVRYFVYASTNPGYTNLTKADVIWQTNDVNTTNYIHCPATMGKWYYYVTSLDDYPVYTNESWYSVEASATAGVISIFVTNTNLFYTNVALNFTTASQVCSISNDGTLPCKVVGQINDFTNNTYATPLVWDVTNAAVLSKDQVRVEIKTSPNGVIPNWTAIVNKDEIFTIDDNLPVGDVVELYIRITTPPSTSSTKPYKSRIRATAQAP